MIQRFLFEGFWIALQLSRWRTPAQQMAGLAQLARRRRELEELDAFVEDIEFPPELVALGMESGRGLGDCAEWIRPLRDMISRVDHGSRPLFVRFIEAEVLAIDTWHRYPLLTVRVSWQSQCSPAKVRASLERQR